MAVAPYALLIAVALSRLPKPPDKVVLETKYGNVTVNHKAHLARRAACVKCHGEGQIHKIGSFGMTLGHERCRGCHKDENKGPMECGGCHAGAKGVDG